MIRRYASIYITQRVIFSSFLACNFQFQFVACKVSSKVQRVGAALYLGSKSLDHSTLMFVRE